MLDCVACKEKKQFLYYFIYFYGYYYDFHNFMKLPNFVDIKET